MNKKQISIINRMMKEATNSYIGYTMFNGRFAYTDSHRVFICDEILEDYKKELFFKYDNILKWDKQTLKMELNAKDLKEFIKSKELKRGKNIIPFIYKNEIAFNPFYLLDIIEFCNAKELYYRADKLSTALFKNENDLMVGGVMPMNFKK